MKKREFRILWHGVAPFVSSGYGILSKHLALRIGQYYPLLISCYYGLDPGASLRINGIRVLPTTEQNWGEYSVKHYIQKFKITLPILASDFWPFYWFASLPNSMCYGPIDSEDYSEEDIKCLKTYSYFIPCSEFGGKVYEKLTGRKPTMVIPHGVNLEVFHPYPKEEARKIFGLPRKKFIFGVVAANSDPEPRKGWDDLFFAFSQFLKRNKQEKKNVLLFAFTKPSDRRGLNLPEIAKKLGLEKHVLFPEHLAQMAGLPEREMAKLYSCFDLFINTSRREGFGLPVLEAQACGIPVIAPHSSSLVELVKGHGWLVKTKEVVFTPRGWPCRKVDREDLIQKIEEAYFEESLRKKYSKLSLDFAKQFDWDLLFREKWLPLLETIKEKNLNKIASKRT